MYGYYEQSFLNGYLSEADIQEFPFLHYDKTCSFPVHIAFKSPSVRLTALLEDDDPVYS
jgi:hypothetical protein